MRLEALAHEEEQALVDACVAGDRAARRELVRLYYRAVAQTVGFLPIARSGSVLRADIDDAVQQVFLAIFCDDAVVLRRWRGTARLKTYLCRITERVAQRHFHRGLALRGRFRLSLDAPDPGGAARSDIAEELLIDPGPLAANLEQRLAVAEERDRIRAAILDRLTPKGREYYEFLFVQELDVVTIAEREGTTANNVYQWKNRIARVAAEALVQAGYEA